MLPDRDHPDWTRHRGDPIPREELQRIDDLASGTASVWPADADVLAVRAAGTASGATDRRGFWARIISLDATSPARYSFQQVVGDVEDPRNRFDQQGGVGPGAVAYEQGDNPTVSVGAVVWMERGGPAYYEFRFDSAGSPLSPVSPSSPTVTISSDQTPLVVPANVGVVPISADLITRVVNTIDDGSTPTDRAGRRLTLYAVPSSPGFTLAATTTTGTAADRIINPTGLNLVVQPGQSVPLRYDGATSRWVVESPSPLWTGTPTAGRVPYSDPSGPLGLLPSSIRATAAGLVGIGVTPLVDVLALAGSLGLYSGGLVQWRESLPSTPVWRLEAAYAGNNGTFLELDDTALLAKIGASMAFAVGSDVGDSATTGGLTFVGGIYVGGTLSVSASDVTGLAAISTTGNGADLVAASVTYAKIQNVSATARILGRKTAGAGSVEECTLSDVLDFVGSAAQGDVLYRGATTWTRLGAGTSGLFLQTQGAGANPQWATPATGSGTVTSVGASGPAGILTWSSAVTTNGTLTATFVNQTASTFLAGPSSGGAAAPTFRTIAALDLPIMGAAGAAHAAGAVPDPGATAHTNVPYVLGDAGAFVKPLGRLLGSSYVSTDQTTTSTSYVDLATADSVTFTLDVTSDVLVLFLCETYSTVANDTTNSIVTLDGTDQTGTGTQTTIPTASGPQPGYATAKLTSLAAGSHTIKIRHRLQSGGTGTAHFLCRSLSVFLAG